MKTSFFAVLQDLSLFMKKKYIMYHRIYDMIFYITITLIGNIKMNSTYDDFALASLNLLGWELDIVSPIKEFTWKLYNSVFTNIVTPNNDIPINIIPPETKVNIDLSNPCKLPEPERLPQLLNNLYLDLDRRVRLYQYAFSTENLNSGVYQIIIDNLITQGGSDRNYWQMSNTGDADLKFLRNINMAKIIHDNVNLGPRTPYTDKINFEVLRYLKAHTVIPKAILSKEV